jgi:hypothetical protein
MYARKFGRNHGGMSNNVGIPVPLESSRSEAVVLRLNRWAAQIHFYTESKNVTQTYFAEDREHTSRVDTGRDNGRTVQIESGHFEIQIGDEFPD